MDALRVSFEKPGEDPLTLIEMEMWAKCVRWHFAHTMRYNPHFYCKREEQSKEMFFRVIEHMRKYGYVARWGGRSFMYYDIGDHYYWTMNPKVQACQIINRKKLDRR